MSTFCFLLVAALIAQVVVSLPIADKTIQKRHAAPVYVAPAYHYAPSGLSSSSFVSGAGGSGGEFKV
uniref:Uncharacterized protein n=1 Tax=Meloidogyne enterolobii TaxID=390850 RepID=A0A6V7V4D6_MELEN|nr:unnamed protein product [Meloidogyne enterolobii]